MEIRCDGCQQKMFHTPQVISLFKIYSMLCALPKIPGYETQMVFKLKGQLQSLVSVYQTQFPNKDKMIYSVNLKEGRNNGVWKNKY